MCFFPITNQNELLFAEIELNYAKEAENERAKQQMNLMPGGSSEFEFNIQPPSFGARNFLQVNDLQPNHQFSRHDQTAFQQV
ncbi:hypothetical protein RHMOL_Rhmol02G0176300 [Rhododendron molle]|uniref:Uncharacterized protein n=1 Tax=Rhododendron molle TaxID=49168 RepID=A0ACC0PRE3_RHOML|nr:hypothetical protein RHMOL_Rhmol02G0176300 [Rhododendron molle]